MKKKTPGFDLPVFPALGLVILFCLCVAGTGCSEDKYQSFMGEKGSGSGTPSFFIPTEDDIILDKETGLKIIKNVISVTFSPSTSRETIEKIISSINGEIVGYDYSVNFLQVRVDVANIRELDQIRNKILAQHKEIELTSRASVSAHKNPYYVR